MENQRTILVTKFNENRIISAINDFERRGATVTKENNGSLTVVVPVKLSYTNNIESYNVQFTSLQNATEVQYSI